MNLLTLLLKIQKVESLLLEREGCEKLDGAVEIKEKVVVSEWFIIFMMRIPQFF